MKKANRFISLLATIGLSLALTACGSSTASESKLDTIKLDYATYSPLSLVIKKMGWAEEEFQKDGVEVTWTLSQGSNKALEFLASKSVDFGSASGAASLISRSKDDAECTRRFRQKSPRRREKGNRPVRAGTGVDCRASR